MRIRVTQKNIDNGEVANCRSCPIALAIGREALVENERVRIYRKWYQLPKVTIEFIKAFDEGHEVMKPFEFKIDQVVAPVVPEKTKKQ